MYDRGWCYTSCLKCKRKVTEKESKLFCENCGDYVIGNSRYKIHVKVVDGSDNANFLLWNDVVNSIIGKTAAEVCESMVLVIISTMIHLFYILLLIHLIPVYVYILYEFM